MGGRGRRHAPGVVCAAGREHAPTAGWSQAPGRTCPAPRSSAIPSKLHGARRSCLPGLANSNIYTVSVAGNATVWDTAALNGWTGVNPDATSVQLPCYQPGSPVDGYLGGDMAYMMNAWGNGACAWGGVGWGGAGRGAPMFWAAVRSARGRYPLREGGRGVVGWCCTCKGVSWCRGPGRRSLGPPRASGSTKCQAGGVPADAWALLTRAWPSTPAFSAVAGSLVSTQPGQDATCGQQGSFWTVDLRVNLTLSQARPGSLPTLARCRCCVAWQARPVCCASWLARVLAWGAKP